MRRLFCISAGRGDGKSGWLENRLHSQKEYDKIVSNNPQKGESEMGKIRFGTRVHDMGKGTPEEMFEKIGTHGFQCVQLAYKKGISGVSSYGDVTLELVERTLRAAEKTGVDVAVHGTYVELSLVDEEARKKQTADFISQIPYTKLLGAGCQGSETTNMSKQPVGTTRAQAQRALLKSLEEIMPHAEAAGVTVAVEPVFYHAMNTPEAAKMVLDSIASPNLKIIFDAANLISYEDVNRQEAMWDRAMTLWGDKIVAVHIKGVAFDDAGNFHSTVLEDSCLDYPLIARYVRQLEQDLPVMREEEKPERTENDLRMLRQWFLE